MKVAEVESAVPPVAVPNHAMVPPAGAIALSVTDPVPQRDPPNASGAWKDVSMSTRTGFDTREVQPELRFR